MNSLQVGGEKSNLLPTERGGETNLLTAWGGEAERVRNLLQAEGGLRGRKRTHPEPTPLGVEPRPTKATLC